MRIRYFTGGPVAVNTYFVINDKKECVIIDPSDAETVFDIIDQEELAPLAILLTHGHYDHFWGLDDFLKRYEIPVYIFCTDAQMLTNNELNLSIRFGHYSPDKFKFNSPVTVKDGDLLSFSDMNFKVIHTPGHTAGGACFLIDDCMFTGDTLFRMTVGRTDCYTADINELKRSVELLSRFDDNITIFPGHGRPSSIGFEKKYNPFMNGGFDNI